MHLVFMSNNVYCNYSNQLLINDYLFFHGYVVASIPTPTTLAQLSGATEYTDFTAER